MFLECKTLQISNTYIVSLDIWYKHIGFKKKMCNTIVRAIEKNIDFKYYAQSKLFTVDNSPKLNVNNYNNLLF